MKDSTQNSINTPALQDPGNVPSLVSLVLNSWILPPIGNDANGGQVHVQEEEIVSILDSVLALLDDEFEQPPTGVDKTGGGREDSIIGQYGPEGKKRGGGGG